MEEIKVVPYIPDEDYDNPAMVVDFYEFTMANCLFLNGFKDTTLVFDMFFRKNRNSSVRLNSSRQVEERNAIST